MKSILNAHMRQQLKNIKFTARLFGFVINYIEQRSNDTLLASLLRIIFLWMLTPDKEFPDQNWDDRGNQNPHCWAIEKTAVTLE